ncbi:hypothetical protein IPV09_01995 [Tessaracoccus sp. SD287]|uniref:hypothetical protein n=1 Tax=Tessaracoccus sp. SD287 TaxID=2782008 RepID=UPI001A963C05|nr:hypothetical protein [Tessaracoccus sp. SD287]MBO1030104.1 hypothetical protein [Tessaracoccus sp. SD287]
MPDKTAVDGSVGEAADTCVLQVQNRANEAKNVVVHVRASSLCHSHAAFACLVVGAEARASRVDLNDTHMHLTTEAKAGEHVVLVVNLVARDNGVLCMRLGTISFELELVDVA